MSELIGLVGVVVGVVLNEFVNFLRRRGKIEVFTDETTISFRELDIAEGSQRTRVIDTSSEIEVPLSRIHRVVATIEADFYNSSATDTKIARDIKYVIKSNEYKRVGRFRDPDKPDKKDMFQPSALTDLTYVKLASNGIQNLRVSIIVEVDIIKFLNADWFIEYKDGKNKLKSIKLKKPDVSHIKII